MGVGIKGVGMGVPSVSCILIDVDLDVVGVDFTGV